ncbi:hypothetical protein CANINC_001298 [Pichia inconspicua]|uniref:Dienelactone hydrolase domain-containing protein n=1 Tax=Pichia inconspicua TaxID=52247 RepID=A0A4T0X3Z8_9ASCO|nr:hypothetical protein CANINC_001298 [[Candida] inconspicua]
MASNPPSTCCTKVTLHTGNPTGSITKFAGLQSYITSNYSSSSTRFLIIFTDIYGIKLPNTQLVADTFASLLGYPVIVPDILQDDIYINGTDFNDWFSRHPPQLTIDILKTFFLEFQNKHPKIDFIAGIGYCFGAKYLSHYLTNDSFLKFDVGAFAHPSFVSEDELNAITKPLIISAAETDTIFPRDLRYKSEEILQKNGIHYQIDLFQGVEHGFTVRGDLNNKFVKYAAEKALTDQVAFFKFHEN